MNAKKKGGGSVFSAPLSKGLNLEHRRVAVANLKHETGQSLSNIITGHVVQIVATAVVAEDDVPTIGNNLPIAKHGVRGSAGDEDTGVLVSVMRVHAVHEDVTLTGLTGMTDEREHGSGSDAILTEISTRLHEFPDILTDSPIQSTGTPIDHGIRHAEMPPLHYNHL